MEDITVRYAVAQGYRQPGMATPASSTPEGANTGLLRLLDQELARRDEATAAGGFGGRRPYLHAFTTESLSPWSLAAVLVNVLGALCPAAADSGGYVDRLWSARAVGAPARSPGADRTNRTPPAAHTGAKLGGDAQTRCDICVLPWRLGVARALQPGPIPCARA